MKTAKGRGRNKEWLVVTGICLVVLVVYANVFGNGLVADDWQFVENWPATASWRNLPKILAGAVPVGHEGVFRPVRGLLYLTAYQVWGKEVFFYHAFSVAVLLVSMLLVYLIVKKLTRKWEVGSVAALFFGLTPVHTEAITWISSNFDSSGSVWVLLSFYWWVAKEKPWQKAAAVGMGVVALLANEVAVGLVLLITAYEWIWNKKKGKELVKVVWWWWALAAAYLILRLGIIGRGRGEFLAGSPIANSLLSVYVWFEYVKLMMVPLKLSYVHELIWGVGNLNFGGLGLVELAGGYWRQLNLWVAIVAVGLVGWLVVKLRRRERLVSFGVAWMALTLVPAVNLVPGAMIFGEKYTYLASVGWSMATAGILAWGWNKLDKVKRKGLVVGVAVVLVVFGVVTIRRNQEWKSEVSLWRAETRNNPKAGRAWMELGLAYEKTGKPEEAVEAYNRVIAKSPDVDAGYLAAAAINQSRGNYGAAVGNYEGLVAVAPNDGSARSFLAYLRQVWAQKLVDQGEGRLAVAQLKKAMEEDIGLQLAGEIGKICRADPGACRE